MRTKLALELIPLFLLGVNALFKVQRDGKVSFSFYLGVLYSCCAAKPEAAILVQIRSEKIRLGGYLKRIKVACRAGDSGLVIVFTLLNGMILVLTG
jgi:hypothetical protein